MSALNTFIEYNTDSPEISLPKYYYILVTLIWIGIIFSPFDRYATGGDIDFIQSFFDRRLFKFDYFQVIALVFLFLSVTFIKKTRKDKFLITFTVLNCIVLAISLFNPNNNLTPGQYLYIPDLLNFYYLCLFSYIILNINNEQYITIFNKIIMIGAYVLLTKCIVSLLLYFTGRGSFFADMPSTIPQMDILIYISAFQIIIFGKYLNTKKRVNLVYIFVFYLTLFFSYRRSALGLSIVADLLLFIYYIVVTPQKIKAIKTFLSFIGIILLLVITLQFIIPDKIEKMFNRFTGAFSYFNKNAQVDEEFSDSGHMEQSIETTKVFFDKVNTVFWGSGFGNRAYFIEGQAGDDDETLGGIHNSFVYSWAAWGMHVTMYLVVLCLIFFRIIIKLIKMRLENFVIAGVIIYLLYFLLLGWTNGILFLSHLQYIIVFVLLFSVIKFIPQYGNLVEEEEEEEEAYDE